MLFRFIALVAVLLINPRAVADDYKYITDAAYCTGVVSHDIATFKKEFDITLPGDQTNLLRLHAIVQGAIKQGKVDMSTTNTLFLVGQKDAQQCWDTTLRCMNAGFKDNTADPKKTFADCMLQSEHVCKRTKTC